MVIKLLALLLAAGQVSTPSEDKAFVGDTSQFGIWMFISYPNMRDCSMVAEFEDNSTLSIHWFPRAKNMAIMVYNKKFASIENDKKYHLKVLFLKGKKLDDGWGEREAIGIKDDSDEPGFRVSLSGEEALFDVATSSTIGFMKGDQIVASLSLDDSAKAVNAIQQCSAKVLKEHPIDPFEG